jgi:hypothetical protein
VAIARTSGFLNVPLRYESSRQDVTIFVDEQPARKSRQVSTSITQQVFDPIMTPPVVP